MTPNRPAMDYSEIDTAEQLLNAFKQCQNAGEEIQLFESLAEMENPPVEAFVEILRKIKLETVLALAIQAFGKITNDNIKADLKDSTDLLLMLCEQAKSGATDLIRWSAATTIEKIGFSFIDVSQYLTEEPEVIIQRIVQSKVRTLMDGRNNDYESILRFWVYGATYELRAATVNQGGENAAIVVNAVVKAQDIWGIRNINLLLIELLQDCKPDFFSFIFAGQNTSESILLKSTGNSLNSSELGVLISNQIFCVGSYHSEIRRSAAKFLHGNSCLSSASDFSSLNHAVSKIIDITDKVIDISQKEAEIDIAYVDRADIEEIRKSILDEFNSKIQCINTNQSNDLNSQNKELHRQEICKDNINEKIIEISQQIAEIKKGILLFIIASPFLLGIGFVCSWIFLGFFGAILFAILQIKLSDPMSFLNIVSILVSIIANICIALYSYYIYTVEIEKKSENKRKIYQIELEESQINEKIQQIKNRSDLECKQAEDRKRRRIAGIEKIDKLLDEREKMYELVESPIGLK
jgi:hypothetical protein